MNNNDLIRRGDVLKAFDENIIWGAPRIAIENIPAIEQPMSAVEYERERGRFFRWCDSRKCEWCEWKLNCRDLTELSSLSPEERVEFFMKWAQEHPEEAEE